MIDINKFKNKTILITGVNGLIGGTLTDYFCNINEKYNLGIKLILKTQILCPQSIKQCII